MTDSMQVVMTPTVSRFARRSIFWVALAAIIILIAGITIALSSSAQSADPMSATSAAPNGAKALVEVLRHEGVTVVVADSLDEASDAVRDRENTTVFFYDPEFFLDSAQTEDAMHLADSVVVLLPTHDALAEISNDIAQAGFFEGTPKANCPVDAAQAAESIATEGDAYRILDGDAVGCFAIDDAFAMVQLERDGATYTALGTANSLSNGAILNEGNAALGLNLLGANDTLVWYVPTAADYETDVATIDELSPDWVQPLVLTFFLVAIAAMIWRGRRLGPLVVENLPVTVKASETMQGRARLYEKSNARLHTLDSLRIGTIARLAALCGLPVLATVDEIVAASASIAGMDPSTVRLLLVDARPASDRELVRLSDELLVLEQTVQHKLRPH